VLIRSAANQKWRGFMLASITADACQRSDYTIV
jgi:hypothetical protein